MTLEKAVMRQWGHLRRNCVVGLEGLHYKSTHRVLLSNLQKQLLGVKVQAGVTKQPGWADDCFAQGNSLCLLYLEIIQHWTINM